MAKRAWNYSQVLCLVSLAFSVQADVSQCDTSLVVDRQNPLSYQARGERCEGLYVEQVAANALRLVSLTAQFDKFNAQTEDTLQVTWPHNPKGPIHIRATSLHWNIPYRLDASRAVNQEPFSWPTALLDAIGLQQADIGVVGWISDPQDTAQPRLLVPLSVTRETPAVAGDSTYRLVLAPGITMEEVFLSIAPVTQEGIPGSFFVDGKALRYGYYPAHQPFEITLDGFPSPGQYYVEIGARLRSGGTSTLTFLMQHGPE